MREIRNKHQFNHCLNCEKSLTEEANFCTNCGQKRITGRISFWEIVKDLFDATFSLDARLLRSILTLFVPGKLTIAYFSGHHVRYWQPLRLFLFLAVLQITAIGLSISSMNEQITKSNDALKTEISSYITIKHLDSLKPLVARQFSNKKMATAAIDTLLHAYYSPSILAKNNLINRDSLRLVIVEKLAKDSIALDEEAIDNAVEKAIDAKNNGIMSALIKTNSMDSMALPPVNIGYNDGKETSLVMHKKDFYNLSADELIKKYKVEGFQKQLVTKQLIKTMKDGKSGVDYFMGKLSWMIILLMPFLAILLELMNRKFYYVEHLIFSFHCHCMVFLVASIMTFCDIFLKNTIFTSVSGGMVFIYLMAYFYFALKNVYQQGWFKTLLKFCFLSFSYLFMLCVFFVLTIVVSFIFF
jgi:Protein of unknown function (DUF3667)